MRVVIRFRRKSAKVSPALDLSLNGASHLVPEPVVSVAVAEPELLADVVEPQVAVNAAPPAPPVEPQSATPEPVIAEPLPISEDAPAAAVDAPPPVRKKTESRAEKVRCPRCNSSDTWRFGRVKGMRLAMASLARGQWITCRGCGNRFLTRFYGPMEEDDED